MFICEEKDMRKKTILTVMICVMTLICVVSCASTKEVTTSMKTNNVDVKPRESFIVDWTGRGFGVEASPQWMQTLFLGNSDMCKTALGIDNSYIVKFSLGQADSKVAAEIISKVLYNSQRSEELKTTVLSEAAITLDKDAYKAISDAAIVAKVKDISGHELVTQFTQEWVTINKDTGLEESRFDCYSIYKIPKDIWLETIKSYMKSVIPSLPDTESKKKMAESINKIYEHTTSNDLKTKEEKIAEINAKQEAIHNSAPGSNPDDLVWLDVLETACNIIF